MERKRVVSCSELPSMRRQRTKWWEVFQWRHRGKTKTSLPLESFGVWRLEDSNLVASSSSSGNSNTVWWLHSWPLQRAAKVDKDIWSYFLQILWNVIYQYFGKRYWKVLMEHLSKKSSLFERVQKRNCRNFLFWRWRLFPDPKFEFLIWDSNIIFLFVVSTKCSLEKDKNS